MKNKIKLIIFWLSFFGNAWCMLVVSETEPDEVLQTLRFWEKEIEKIPQSIIDDKIESLLSVINIMKTYAKAKAYGFRRGIALWKATYDSHLIQGLIVVSPNLLKEGYFEIDALGSAPWNLVEYDNSSHKKVKKVGTLLMNQALNYAYIKKAKGITVISSLSAKGFYKKYFSNKDNFGYFDQDGQNMSFTF